MAVLVVSYGGGINSLAMLVGMRERGLVPDAITFSDTRGEKPETYAHMREVLAPWLGSVGFPQLITLCRADFGRGKTGDLSLENECLRLGNLPSRAFGYSTCADKWKIDPQKWWAATWPPAVAAWGRGETVTKAIGFDAGEERRVSAVGDRGFEKWYPLIEWRWGREECVSRIKNAGLAVPPKSACYFCPSSTKSEVIALSKSHPELMRRAIAMEAAARATGRWSVEGLGRRFAWADIVRADEAQLSLIPEAVVEPCTICADGEDEDE